MNYQVTDQWLILLFIVTVSLGDDCYCYDISGDDDISIQVLLKL